LLAGACTKVWGEGADLLDDRALVLGLLGSSAAAPEFDQVALAAELARREFRDAVGGVPSSPPRPVAWVECDVEAGASPAPALDHLLNALDVPAVLTVPLPSWEADLANPLDPADPFASGSPFERAGAIAFTPVGVDDVAYAYDGTFFTIAPSSRQVPWAQASVVALSEQQARADGLTGELRLALLVPSGGDARGAGAATFRNHVRFNGKEADENGGNYREFVYDDGPGADAAATFDRVAAFGPHLAVCFGGGCSAAALALEAARPGGAYYVLPSEARTPELRAQFVGEPARRRLLGIMPGRAAADPLLAQFRANLAGAFPGASPDRLAPYAYDESYILLLALGAAADPPAGLGLADALRARFGVGGAPASVGAAGLPNAAAELRSGNRINLRGAMADARFNAGAGLFAEGEFQVWCASADPEEGFVDTGLRYETGPGGLAGVNTCF
jgi:hypothetical protein